MPTFSQLIKNPRIPKLHKIKALLLVNQPQKRAICFRIFNKNPKKPNSAKRKVANVGFIKKLSIFSFKKVNVLTYIPGIGNHLQANSNVLFRGGRVKDLPGVRYHLIRGVLDFNGVKDRKNARSKYGTKKFNV